MALAGLAISIVVALGLHREAVRNDWERFGEQTRRIRGALDTRVEKYQLALEGLRDFVSRNPEMTPGEWRLRVETLNPPVNYGAFLRLEHWRAEPTNPWPSEMNPPMPIERWASNRSVILAVQNSGFTFHPQLVWRVPGLRLPPDDTIPVDVARVSIRGGDPRINLGQVISLDGQGRNRWGTMLVVPVLGQELAAAWDSPRIRGRTLPVRSRFQQGVVCGALDWNRLLRDTRDAQYGEVECDIFSAPKPEESSWLTRRRSVTNSNAQKPLALRTVVENRSVENTHGPDRLSQSAQESQRLRWISARDFAREVAA